MSALKVLHVTGGPASLDLVREININAGKRGTFTGTGDNATVVHAGRSGPASGTVTVEDATTAQTICSAAKADAVFTCQGDAGAVSVTVTGFIATGYQVNIGDGSKDSEAVPGFAVSFVATSVAIAAGA